jgi:ABC-type Na+ efflux pump permease subunit
MKEIIPIAFKEIFELKSSKKVFLLLFIGASVPTLVMIFNSKGSDSLLPLEMMITLYPICIAYFASIQFLMYSIIEEKRQKTLEILLSMNIKKISIILGKVIPAAIISCFFSLVTLGQLKILSIVTTYIGTVNISLFLIICLFIVAYLGTNVCLLSSLLILDEKVIFTVFFSLSVLIGYILISVNKYISISQVELLLALLVLSVLITLLNNYMFIKKVDLITNSNFAHE